MKPYREHMLAAAREYWEWMLFEHKTVVKAARAAQVNRQNLHKMLRRIGLREGEKKTRYARRGDWRGIGAR